MDLTSRISADIIRALPDDSLQKLNKLLDNDDVSEEQIRSTLEESGVNLDELIKNSTGKE